EKEPRGMIPPETTSEDPKQMSTTGDQPQQQTGPQPNQPVDRAPVDRAPLDRAPVDGAPVDGAPEPVEAAPDREALGRREGQGHTITVRDLHAYYGKVHAVKGIDIDFPSGEVTAIIGPSGCGKSTMVRCINRMHEEIPGARSEGSVKLDTLDLYDPGVDITAVRRLIGMVFQKPNPFPTMSIFDNVAAGPRLTGTKGDNLRERVHKS